MHTAGIVKYYEAYYAKVINVLAVLSFVGTVGIIGGGTYFYLQKDAISEIKKQVTLLMQQLKQFQEHFLV